MDNFLLTKLWESLTFDRAGVHSSCLLKSIVGFLPPTSVVVMYICVDEVLKNANVRVPYEVDLRPTRYW